LTHEFKEEREIKNIFPFIQLDLQDKLKFQNLIEEQTIMVSDIGASGLVR